MDFEVVVTKKGQTTIPVRLRKKFKIEEGTAMLNAECVSDDPHFKQIKEIHTTWI